MCDFPDLYDADGLIRTYRAAINEALPEGVILAEDNRFYGPYPVDDELKADIVDTIDNVNSNIAQLLKLRGLRSERRNDNSISERENHLATRSTTCDWLKMASYQ